MKLPSISCVRPATDECRFLEHVIPIVDRGPFSGSGWGFDCHTTSDRSQPRPTAHPPPHVSCSSGSPPPLAPRLVHTIEAIRAPIPCQWLIWKPPTTGAPPIAHNRGQPRTPPPHVSGSSGSPLPRAPRRGHATETHHTLTSLFIACLAVCVFFCCPGESLCGQEYCRVRTGLRCRHSTAREMREGLYGCR